jgi:hypothetical protein
MNNIYIEILTKRPFFNSDETNWSELMDVGYMRMKWDSLS